jgi:hypothetical protein
MGIELMEWGVDMQGRCDKHLFEQAEDRCGRCGQEFCAECLVYSFGPSRPPFCIPCAVASSGVRNRGAVSAPRKALRRIEKERKLALKAARKGDVPSQQPMPVPAAAPAPAPEPGLEPSFEPGYAAYPAS